MLKTSFGNEKASTRHSNAPADTGGGVFAGGDGLAKVGGGVSARGEGIAKVSEGISSHSNRIAARGGGIAEVGNDSVTGRGLARMTWA